MLIIEQAMRSIQRHDSHCFIELKDLDLVQYTHTMTNTPAVFVFE